MSSESEAPRKIGLFRTAAMRRGEASLTLKLNSEHLFSVKTWILSIQELRVNN